MSEPRVEPDIKLNIERVFGEPELSGRPPVAVHFSPDGEQVTFLQSTEAHPERQDLWSCRLDDGEISCLVAADSLTDSSRQLSDEEKAARERRRISQGGIVEYLWHPDSSRLLFPLAGHIFVYDTASRTARQLTPTDTFQTDVRISPDGRHVSFIRQRDIYVIALDTQIETRLTFDASDTVSNGLPEFIAQEEMHRFEGYWWSPDSQCIAFLQVDESSVELTHRFEIEADSFGIFAQRYPFAGRPNALVRAGLVSLDNSLDQDIQWIDLDREPDSYIARVDWLSDGSRLAVQVQSRNQQRLDLVICGPDSNARTILTETSPSWLNLNDHFRSLPVSGNLLWGSERSGFCHLYLISREGEIISPLTQGDWVVRRVCAVDEARGLVYFEGYADTPLENHLYEVPLDGSQAPRRVTRAGQTHTTELDRNFTRFIDRYAAPDQPPAISVRALADDSSDVIFANSLDAAHPFFPYLATSADVTFGTLTAADGQALHYRLLQPKSATASKPVPAIVTVYGGPGVQRVTRDWIPPWHHYMAARGYALLSLDNRGSSDRGRDFESPIYGHMGDVEVADQLLGAQFLQSLPWIDANRLGVFGHSYGGYMTLLLMMKGKSVFRAGVSVAPVTDWHLYDTHYTERFLGHPDANPDGYEQSSVFPFVSQLSGALLLIHGMADDNVLFTHTTRLLKSLQEHNTGFEFMAYPGAKHGITGRANNIHRYSMMDTFFDKHLGPHNG